jgi:hypothetical protein
MSRIESTLVDADRAMSEAQQRRPMRQPAVHASIRAD